MRLNTILPSVTIFNRYDDFLRIFFFILADNIEMKLEYQKHLSY